MGSPTPDGTAFLDAAYAVDRVRYARMVLRGQNIRQMFPWQERFVGSAAKFKVADCSRQAGKSSIVAPIPTHYGRFRPGSSGLVLAATEQQAFLDIGKIRACMAADPRYPKLTRASDSLIMLDNGSRIEVMPATEKSARGLSKPNWVILEEGSRIPDEVIASGIIPMLNDNPECEFMLISTPNGRTGFFFRASNSKNWERYLVRSPYTPVSSTELRPMMPESEFQEMMAKDGILAWYSPRHADLAGQMKQLEMMGQRLYRQENGAEFVEPEEQLFSYEDIQAASSRDDYNEDLIKTDLPENDFDVL